MNRSPADPRTRRLLEICQTLADEQVRSLLEFGEFLADRYGVHPRVTAEKQDIPRPKEESVVQAIKRLRATYPMLDESKLLHETSELFSEHVLGGKGAPEVIDRLETLFLQRYKATGQD